LRDTAGNYVSEPDFVCRFLAKAIEDYSSSGVGRLEYHVEEPMVGPAGDDIRADLTVRRDGRKLLVVEAKLDVDPWQWEVVEEGAKYALKFDYFATCNPLSLVLFGSGPQPFQSALALLDYEPEWVARLFDLMDHPPSLKPLYSGLLVHAGAMAADVAELYEEVRLMNEGSNASTLSFSEAPYRLVATSAPKGFTLGPMGRYWDLETAGHNQAGLEAKGFGIKIQSKIKEKWKDLDIDQGKLGD
jgi:hypothetical protein